MADAVLYGLRVGLAHYYRKTIIEVTSIFNPFELIHITRKKLKVEGQLTYLAICRRMGMTEVVSSPNQED